MFHCTAVLLSAARSRSRVYINHNGAALEMLSIRNNFYEMSRTVYYATDNRNITCSHVQA